MLRIPYQVPAKTWVDQSCSGRSRAGILTRGLMARLAFIRLGLLCAVIGPMGSGAEAGILGVRWELDATAIAAVDYHPDLIDRDESYSNGSDSSDLPGGLSVSALAVAAQGGTIALGTSLTRMRVSDDMRSGSFSSETTAGNSIGLDNVTYGANGWGGGHLEWDVDDNGEVSFVWGLVNNEPLSAPSSIRVSSNAGTFDYGIPGIGAFGRATQQFGGFQNELTFSHGGIGTGFPDTENFSTFAVVWGRNGLPGLSAMDAFMPQAGEFPGIFNFTIPVMQDYGIGNTLYFDPVFATGYEYRVDGSRFASFTLPGALPGGDDMFQLEFNGVFYDLMAGSVFDFTSIDPLGASQFFLRGIDPSEMIDPNLNPPFVSGLSFTSQGIADVSQIALTSDVTAVPEPSSFCIMMALMGIVGVYRWRTISNQNKGVEQSAAQA